MAMPINECKKSRVEVFSKKDTNVPGTNRIAVPAIQWKKNCISENEPHYIYIRVAERIIRLHAEKFGPQLSQIRKFSQGGIQQLPMINLDFNEYQINNTGGFLK